MKTTVSHTVLRSVPTLGLCWMMTAWIWIGTRVWPWRLTMPVSAGIVTVTTRSHILKISTSKLMQVYAYWLLYLCNLVGSIGSLINVIYMLMCVLQCIQGVWQWLLVMTILANLHFLLHYLVRWQDWKALWSGKRRCTAIHIEIFYDVVFRMPLITSIDSDPFPLVIWKLFLLLLFVVALQWRMWLKIRGCWIPHSGRTSCLADIWKRRGMFAHVQIFLLATLFS